MEIRLARSGKFTAAAFTLCIVCALGVTGLTFLFRPADNSSAPKDEKGHEYRTLLKMPPGLFRGWEKPDVALLLSGEQHGYVLPCGCSRPQFGGLERRFNLLAVMRQQGWPVAALDLGDIPQREGPRKLANIQGKIKYKYSMEALDQMGYLAVGIGEYEAALSLFDVLAEYALNKPTPKVLFANLKDRAATFSEGEVGDHIVRPVPGSKLKLGVTGIIGPSVQKEIKDGSIKFDDNRTVLQPIAKTLCDKADLRVLLYQGSLQEAKLLATDMTDFHVILCRSAEDEPSAEPTRVGSTLVVNVGHKGRYVGVVGVYQTGKKERPFELRYQLVSLGEEFLTPAGEQARQPVLELMEKYTKELRDQNYLEKYGQSKHTHQVAIPGQTPTYVGTEKCKKCHESAYVVWENSKHAHAYKTLVDAKPPSLRQFDAECIACHTVGFGYESGFRTEKATPHLKDVGCESCHGPASEHVKNPKAERWHALLNPWKPKENETAAEKEQRTLRIDRFCQECHDADNDVKYKFKLRWPDIDHPSP